MSSPTKPPLLISKSSSDRSLRRVWGLSGALLLLVLAVGGMATVWAWGELNRVETLPVQTSPDGSWSITLSGKRLIFGSVEVVGTAVDESGRRRGPAVVGQAPSFPDFRSDYSAIEFQGDAAYVGGQPLMLRPGLKQWPAKP